MLKIPFDKKKEMMAIDVSHLTEVRQGLDYLPWAEALLLLNEHFPGYFVDVNVAKDENGYAHIDAWLVDGESQSISNTLYFPVMDYRHKACENPTPVDINNAIMRATVKVIAIETGIGLSLYRRYKEDIPEAQKREPETVSDSTPVETVKRTNPFKKLS
jgi:hypothetical protein